MIDWLDCIAPIQKKQEPPPKPPKPDKPAYTKAEELAALELEARRRGVSYGVLCYELEQEDYTVKQDIIAAYIAQKRNKTERKRQQCAGCVYHKQLHHNSANTHCTFSQTHRIRRKDAEGMCLEYTTSKKK